MSIPPERARSTRISDDASVPPVVAETPPAPRPTKPAQRAGRGDAAWEVIETIAIAIILFFVMRLLVLPVKVDGQSMLPSLTPDQHLLVNRRAYTHWEIGGHTYYLFGAPHRGDIIVLTPPPVELRQGIPFIKRIVGLPGDTVLVTGGKVLINGKPIDETYIAEQPAYTWPTNGQPMTVPPHNVVVFGDNRNHSEDSSRFGLLDESLIRGRAFLTFYPVREINFLPKPTYA